MYDAPYVAALLPDGRVDVHNVEDQTRVQVIPAPPKGVPPAPGFPPEEERAGMALSVGRYMVPSVVAADKMRRVPVRLVRPAAEGRRGGGELPEVVG